MTFSLTNVQSAYVGKNQFSRHNRILETESNHKKINSGEKVELHSMPSSTHTREGKRNITEDQNLWKIHLGHFVSAAGPSYDPDGYLESWIT